MKLFLTFIIVCLNTAICKSQTTAEDTFDFYFETSKDISKYNTWEKKGDSAIIKLGEWRGDCCGGVPHPHFIKAKIVKDTLSYNLNNVPNPNCDRRIGICMAAINLVINTKKHPNYKNLIWNEIKYENTPDETKIIDEITQKIESPSIVKHEISEEKGYLGAYEKYIVYTDHHVPILIEREEKEVRRLYLKNGERNDTSYSKGIFYITKWDDNQFIRKGKIITAKGSRIIEMHKDMQFEYDRNKVIQLINK